MEDNFWYLFAAYSIIWTVVLGFVYSLFARERSLERELDSLKKRMRSESREGQRTERPAAPTPRSRDGSGLFDEVAVSERHASGP